jgi:hypothetical protein
MVSGAPALCATAALTFIGYAPGILSFEEQPF